MKKYGHFDSVQTLMEVVLRDLEAHTTQYRASDDGCRVHLN